MHSFCKVTKVSETTRVLHRADVFPGLGFTDGERLEGRSYQLMVLT